MIERVSSHVLADGDAANSSQAGSSVSFSLYQNGSKLEVAGLASPAAQVSLPVADESKLVTSCVGQPNEFELFERMAGGTPRCEATLECRYWDASAGAWSTDGCATTRYNASGGGGAIGCACSHLSDFVAIELPTALPETIRLGVLHVPSAGAAAGLEKYDMTVSPVPSP